MRITVSGSIGSGKSTVARLIASRLDYMYLSGGEVFRKIASEMGMDIEHFNLYAEKHPEIDREQDDKLLSLIRKNDGIVVDSRLAGWLAHNSGVDALKIYIKANRAERVRRVASREKEATSETNLKILQREESESRRYREFYGIDIHNLEIYDLVIDSTSLSAASVAKVIMAAVDEMMA